MSYSNFNFLENFKQLKEKYGINKIFPNFIYENIVFINELELINYVEKCFTRTSIIYLFSDYIIKEIDIKYFTEYCYAILSKCSLYYQCKINLKNNKMYIYQKRIKSTLYELIVNNELNINQILNCFTLFINFFK